MKTMGDCARNKLKNTPAPGRGVVKEGLENDHLNLVINRL